MNQGPAGQPSDVYSRYGLNRHSEVQTGEQVRERVNRELEQQYGPFGVIIGILKAPNQVDDLLDAQAAKLKGQVLTRPAPEEPGVHYLGIPHQRLHDSVNNGVDPGAVGEMGDIWTTLGNQLATFNDDIVTAIGNSEADWTGKAGDGARQALADMGNRAGETGTSAQLAGTLFTQQSRALSTAKANVPPPPAEPFNAQAANDRLLSMIDPIAMVRQAAADKAAFEQQQKDHQEAARAVETYDRTVAQTAAAQPAFAPAPVAQPQPQPNPPQPNPPSPIDPPGTGEPKARDNTPPPVISGTTDTAWATTPAATGGNTTNPSGVGGTPPPGGNQLGGGNTNPGGGGPVFGGFPPGPNPGRTTTGPNVGRPVGSPPGGPGGGSGTGTGRGGAGGVGRLPGMPGGGVGLPGGAAAAKGIGGSTGMLPGDGTAARGGGSAAGAAGGRGAAGAAAGMAPMGGAGRGQGDEDIEHQSPSYLLEPDPDEVFGTDETTAPPVIGDWSQ
jgi:hypothetical protein